jgi:long-chain fatty acid transport protein
MPGTDLTFGIGLYTPFGLATAYGRSDLTRFAATRSELRLFYITPTIAWRIHPSLSVGLGLSFIHSSALFSRALLLGPGTEGKLKITGGDNTYSATAGLLFKPVERMKFGLTFRGGAELDFGGAHVKLINAAGIAEKARAQGTQIPLPSVISVGLHYDIDSDWSVDFVHDFTHWSEFQHLKARFAPSLLGGALPGIFLKQKWKDTSTFRFGTSYRINETWTLRGGLVLDESPIPAQTLGPSIPGADSLTLNSGLGWQWRSWRIDIGYAAVFSKSRRVNNSVLEANGASNLTPGRDKYATFDNFVSVSIGYKF